MIPAERRETPVPDDPFGPAILGGRDGMTDAEFLASVEGCTFPSSEWTHVAHVRMGWLYCTKGEPFESVLATCRRTIQQFNVAVLHKDAYHETITNAFLRLILSRVCGSPPGETFAAFCLRNPDLLSSQVLTNYFSSQILDSDLARAEVVLPDRAPLP